MAHSNRNFLRTITCWWGRAATGTLRHAGGEENWDNVSGNTEHRSQQFHSGGQTQHRRVQTPLKRAPGGPQQHSL